MYLTKHKKQTDIWNYPIDDVGKPKGFSTSAFKFIEKGRCLTGNIIRNANHFAVTRQPARSRAAKPNIGFLHNIRQVFFYCVSICREIRQDCWNIFRSHKRICIFHRRSPVGITQQYIYTIMWRGECADLLKRRQFWQ